MRLAKRLEAAIERKRRRGRPAKLTPAQLEAAAERYATEDGLSMRQLADELGVDVATISRAFKRLLK